MEADFELTLRDHVMEEIHKEEVMAIDLCFLRQLQVIIQFSPIFHDANTCSPIKEVEVLQEKPINEWCTGGQIVD